ncbi:uncharacterized protein LOC127774534 [Oryza glaberrima]|uniref:Uncharacterized protein n=2 Tax=Oryza TaxID=4527 RepID=A0A0D3G4T6_9ORYZ|nr:uncharacterized protein LOC127774534 [Oryza glaberrima]
MTVASSDEASRSVLRPAPPLKWEDEEAHGSSPGGGGSAGWAVDSGDQENGADLGPVIAVEGLGGLVPQPEVAVVAVELLPQLVQEPGKVSPRIHEKANSGEGENGDGKYRVVYTAGRRKRCLISPGGSDGDRITPRDLAVAFHGQEAGQVAPEAATAAIADGAGVAVDSVLTKMQELVNHGSCGNGKNNVRKSRRIHMKQATAVPVSDELKNLHSQEAEAAHGKITDQSDCEIKKEPRQSCMSSIVGSDDSHISGLSTRLQSLGINITSVTPILSKNVSSTDCHPNQARLLLSRHAVEGSPLLGMLTPLEDALVHSSGLPIEVLDRYGCSYDMFLRYLDSTTSYRLIVQWRNFLEMSHMIPGDLVKLGAFRFEGQLALTLLHYGNAGKAKKVLDRKLKEKKVESNSTVTEKSKELTSRETEESKEELTSRKTDANDEESASSVAEAIKKKWPSEMLEAAETLLMLSCSGDKPKPSE